MQLRLRAHILGDEDYGRGIRRVFREVGIGKTELIGERLRDLPLGRQIQPDKHRSQAFAGPFVLYQCRLQVFFGDDPRLAETFTDHRTHGYPLGSVNTPLHISASVPPSSRGSDIWHPPWRRLLLTPIPITCKKPSNCAVSSRAPS